MAVRTNLSRVPTLEADVEASIEKLATARTTDEKVTLLRRISPKLGARESRDHFSPIVHSSKMIQILAELLLENKQWAADPPSWTRTLISYVYFELLLDIPSNQTMMLLDVFKNSFTSNPNEHSLQMIRFMIRSTKELLLPDTALFDIIRAGVLNERQEISNSAVLCLMAATDNDMEWQSKVLKDTKLITDLLALPGSNNGWYLFANLSQHPDAKVLLPPEVLDRAKKEKFEGCIDVCANLSSETDADSLILNTDYIENRAMHLTNLLGMQNKLGAFFEFSLLDLILPLVNLSVSDPNKETLGKLVIGLLLQVVSIQTDKPLLANIATNLDRNKQEAAKALWNLAFTEPNRKRILDAGGIATLEKILHTSKDGALKKNVSGILYMFDKHEAKATENPVHGHVMISYNWDNQPIVIRLAKSLKELGYHVWLDLEQMGGSTLSAMADAVEGAELVLMCMSRKYKDSPNCRLEGEYVVNRKVTFIPLMMQPAYRPDGWLGITLGAKLYYDFTTQDDWDNKVHALVKGMGNHGKVGNGTSRTTMTPEVHPEPQKLSAKDWKPEELLSWMQAEGIEKHHAAFVKHRIDGRALMELKAILLSPQNILSFLSDSLGISEVGDLFRITAAVRKL